MPDEGKDHAVVLGASMAGLLTATVLSRVYGSVTLVERDVLPAGPGHRRGVPQSRHTHALLASGVRILEELLPGLRAEMVAAGAQQGDLLGNIRWLFSEHRLSRTDIGQPMLFCGRQLLEGQVRDRVRKLPGVAFADGQDVIGLTASADRRRVTGVRVGAEGGADRVIGADLVVDTTGRGSRTPRWLQELGYRPAPVERVAVDVGYSTRAYRLPEGFLGEDRLVLHGWTPRSPRAGAVVAIEGGRHLVTLAGLLGDHPPTDPQAFEEFAGTLHFPDVVDAVRAGEPLDEAVAFRYPANVRHHYERVRDFPDGLLVLGDAACAFNPAYGQGITSSASQARALGRLLAGGQAPDRRRFFRAAAAAVDDPWDISTGSDLLFPGVQGRRTPRIRFVNAYLARLHAAAEADPSLSEAFVRVTGLVAPPRSLLRPDRAVKVLLRGGGPAKARPATAPGP
jgi:2-polyprenyl-6-methoxyphenol hydroxylase-like FAD-dependent oxidoreductase